MRGLAAILTAAAIFFAAGEGHAGFSPVSMFSGFNQSRMQIIATVSVSEQQMFLEVTDGKHTRTALIWKVSTGRKGLETPAGAFKPTWLDIDHKSDQYEDAPMPYAVFFRGGYAIHGTYEVGHLGRPASHGCVRLDTGNAATLFSLVSQYGYGNTSIVISR
jgi:lipoprotein-anchoring transpeptidase ErfK/SrfK